MGDSYEANKRRLERDRAGRQQQQAAASGSNNSRPGASLPRPPPLNTEPSRQQPAHTSYGAATTPSSQPAYQRHGGYGAGESSFTSPYQSSGGYGAGESSFGSRSQPWEYPSTTPGALSEWEEVRRSMPQDEASTPAFSQPSGPRSDPRPPPRSSTGGGSGTSHMAITNVLNENDEEPLRGTSRLPARNESEKNREDDLPQPQPRSRQAKPASPRDETPGPRRKASPRRLAQAQPKKSSEENIPRQIQPADPKEDLKFTPEDFQILKNHLRDPLNGNAHRHMFRDISRKLGGRKTADACRRKAEELTAAERQSGTKEAEESRTKRAARPEKQYIGEATLEEYDKSLAPDWSRVDMIKFHVLKCVCPGISEERLVLKMGGEYSIYSIRAQFATMRFNGFITKRPASRPWTGYDMAVLRLERESGTDEDILMIACIRMREEIQEQIALLEAQDTEVSTKERGDKRKADQREKGGDKSKRGRSG